MFERAARIGAAAQRKEYEGSVLSAGAGSRLAVGVVLAGLLWLAVWWALAG